MADQRCMSGIRGWEWRDFSAREVTEVLVREFVRAVEAEHRSCHKCKTEVRRSLAMETILRFAKAWLSTPVKLRSGKGFMSQENWPSWPEEARRGA